MTEIDSTGPATPTGDTPDAGRIVLVTGGSRGIGAACVDWFLARGFRVASTSRGPVDTASTPRTGHLPISCDVTDPDQVEAAFTLVESTWGPVEILVANAGITKDTLALRMDDASWQSVIDTNLTGAFRVAKRAMARMIRRRSGRIIFISSIGAFIGLPGQANYAASKAGLVGMARALAREVGGRSITVNVVAPGMVATDMITALGDERIEQMRTMVPLGRVGDSAEVADAVGWLASDGAGYVTGVVLPVDGGLGMGW